jgi:curli production assembly/transport component CsgG
MRIFNCVSYFFFFLLGCGAYYNQPTGVERAILGKHSSTALLKDLPKPKEAIV